MQVTCVEAAVCWAMKITCCCDVGGCTFAPLRAGLVYKHFGREVLSSILGIPVSHPDMEAIYLQVYKVIY
jgi:hypothetical protein